MPVVTAANSPRAMPAKVIRDRLMMERYLNSQGHIKKGFPGTFMFKFQLAIPGMTGEWLLIPFCFIGIVAAGNSLSLPNYSPTPKHLSFNLDGNLRIMSIFHKSVTVFKWEMHDQQSLILYDLLFSGSFALDRVFSDRC